MIEKTLKHPEAKGAAYVYKIDTQLIGEYKRVDARSSSMILLEAAQNNMENYLSDFLFRVN